MKASTCSLFASVTPLCSTAIHNYHIRASFKVVSSRKCSAHVTKKRQHLPPWFSVAPMMDWTNNYYRTLTRLISKHAWLYTEMVVVKTIVHQHYNLDRFLAFPPEQHPIVLQIGGSNLDNLSKAAELANGYGYDGINLKIVSSLFTCISFASVSHFFIYFTFPCEPLVAKNDDEVTESKIKAFLDEKALDLMKLQTPLYEEFYNTLNGSSPLGAFMSAQNENSTTYLKFRPKASHPAGSRGGHY